MIFPAIILEIEDERERSFMEALYMHHHQLMHRTARQAGFQAADADDIVSQSCENLIRALSRLKRMEELERAEQPLPEAQYSRTQPEMGRHLRAAERRQRWHSAARKRIPQVLKVAVTGEIGTVTYIKGEDQYVRIRVESKRAEGNIDTEDSSISWIRVHGHEVMIAENFSVIEKQLTQISKYLSQHPSLERPICRGSKEGC